MFKPVDATRDVFDPDRAAMRHAGLRQANERLVLTVVGFNAGVSNAEIARMSGLAPQTVSAILADLEGMGLVERGPVLRGKRGQPATPIALNKDAAYAVGVELGRRHLDVVLINMHAEVLARRRLTHDYPDPMTVADTIAALAGEVADALSDEQRPRLRDIGIAMPGWLAETVDALGAPAAAGDRWANLDLGALLTERLGLEVMLINDGNAGCWAELIALDRPRPANLVYLMVTQNIAAGVVADGSLWEGPSGHAANLGSMLVQLPGGGRAQAHDVASLSALERRLGTRSDGAWPEALAADAAMLDAWMAEAADALAQLVFNTAMMVEAPLVVIETMLSAEVTQALAERVKAALAGLPTTNEPGPRIVAGRMGALGPSAGAAELALFRRYF